MTLEEILRGIAREKQIQINSIHDLVKLGVNSFFEMYPIFNEEYRPQLNEKIVRHFFTREIGYETYGMWRFEFNNMLNEIMPYYNKLYELLEDQPNLFDDTNYWEDGNASHADVTKKSSLNADKRASDSKNSSENIFNESGNENDIVDHNINNSTVVTNTEVKEHHVDYAKDNTVDETYPNGSTEKTTKTGTDTQTTQAVPSIVKSSDTPQGSIADLKAGRYLTNVTITEVSGSSSNPTEYNNTVAQTGHPAEKRTHYKDASTSYDNTVDKTISGNVTSANSGVDTDDGRKDFAKTDRDKKDSLSNASEEGIGGNLEDQTNVREESNDRHVYGKVNSSKSFIELLNEYKDAIMNVDLMVFDALEDCFMLLF